MRDDFARKTRETLAKRVGMLCSNPDCQKPTAGPRADPAKALNVGVAAHITAASSYGPRYNAALSKSDRSAIQNGIWLCRNCATLVESDEHRYTVELLNQWKSVAELTALSSVETNVSSRSPSRSPSVVSNATGPIIVHTGSGNIVLGEQSKKVRRTIFTPGPQHIAPETARQLSGLVDEIVERLTVSGGDVGKAYARVWGSFNAHFQIQTYRELPRDKAENGVRYLLEWRASKNSKLRFADPEKFRTAQLKGIWPRSKSLGFDDSALYEFASRKLKLKAGMTSLSELGNQQLGRLNRLLIYEDRKARPKHKAIPKTDRTKQVGRSEVPGKPKLLRAISNALRLLAEDRYEIDDTEHKRGGWSKTFCTRYVPFAFRDRPQPRMLALNDSITVTHWVIRGLEALRALEKETRCLNPKDSGLLSNLLADVRVYADCHYRDGHGGLFRVLSQQEVKLIPDVRHSATLAKAFLELPGEEDSRVTALLKYVVECALDPDRHDHRVPTHAEILAAIDILLREPRLRDKTLTASMINMAQQRH